MKSPKHRKQAHGFTLVEHLVASICLAGASVGILSALRFVGDQSLTSQYRLIAMQNAASKIELARGQAFASGLTVGTTTSTLNNTGIPGPLTVTTTVTAVAGTPDLYTVRAVASWNGGAKAVTLDSIVRYGNVN